jgi:hypothetical protein
MQLNAPASLFAVRATVFADGAASGRGRQGPYTPYDAFDAFQGTYHFGEHHQLLGMQLVRECMQLVSQWASVCS